MMAAEREPVVGRLAPSPTGKLHLGNLRTFLAAWLSARAAGGTVLLRVEDLDTPRVRPGATAEMVDDLRWSGLDWDGEPVKQSDRQPFYEAALARLREQDAVYPCTCSRADIERAASAPHAGEEGPNYPGTCAGRRAADAAGLAGRRFAWRFRVRESPAFADGLHGPVAIDLARAGGDFVVWRSDGVPAYQLAVVVDDAAQGVTEVVRGDDLLSSTPRQVLLYRALGLTEPRFTHVPLVVGADGQRLAKRHGATALAELRAAGVDPRRVLGLLAWSCGLLAKPEPVTARDLLPRWDLGKVSREPFVIGAEQLWWLLSS
jgi:glutamyl-tRNA synthetase